MLPIAAPIAMKTKHVSALWGGHFWRQPPFSGGFLSDIEKPAQKPAAAKNGRPTRVAAADVFVFAQEFLHSPSAAASRAPLRIDTPSEPQTTPRRSMTSRIQSASHPADAV